MRNETQRGQLLVELMIAATLMIVGMLGTFAVLAQSLGLNRVAGNQYIASGLAAEGIEIVKNIIDTNVITGAAWNEGVAVIGDYGVQYDTEKLEIAEANRANEKLRYDAGTGLYSYGSGDETNFARTVSVTNSGHSIVVNSIVRWKDRGGIDLEVHVEDHFLDWRADL